MVEFKKIETHLWYLPQKKKGPSPLIYHIPSIISKIVQPSPVDYFDKINSPSPFKNEGEGEDNKA